MPGIEHNGIVEMFRENPSLAPHLIEKLFHIKLPSHASAKVVESSLDQMIPIEFRADLVLDLGTLQPLVLGPAVVPQITDPAEAEKETELSILSAVAHGNGPNGLAVVTAAFTALARLDQEHAAVYFQIIWNVLREPMQRALQELVMERQTQGKAQFPPFMQQIVDRSKLEGRTEGRAEARAGDVLTVLRVRGLAVPETARERILAEKDSERLEHWLEKAAVAPSIAEVLDEPS